MDSTTQTTPGLLISVRNDLEAKLVDEIGVDILDIKEPENGALGRASDDVVEKILTVVRSQTKVSAAFGDLEQCEKFLAKGTLHDGLSFAKCGLARVAFANWQTRIESVWSTFRQLDCKPVAVAYADHTLAFSPKPAEILQKAIECGIEYFLIDTFDKHQSNLFDFLSVEKLAELLEVAKNNNVETVLAGSIRLVDLDSVRSLEPEFVGVRGAVCAESRKGEVEAERVLEFKNCLSH